MKADTSVRWKKCIDIFTACFLFLTSIAAIAGSIIGYKAFVEYKNQNSIQLLNTLLSVDYDVYKLMMDKPYLHGLFALPPKGKNPKDSAVQLLKTIIDDKDGKICCKWNNIQELHEELFGSEDFNGNNKQKLREAYFLAENLLYSLLNAYEGKRLKLIRKEDYETYTGYFSELGQNPFFLCAIYLGHRNGYISKEFANEIKGRLLSNQRTKNFVEAIYPDLLKENWIDRFGEGKLN